MSMKYIFLILLIIVSLYAVKGKYENFNSIKDDDMDLMNIENNNKIKYLDLETFNNIVLHINKIIYDELLKTSQSCSKMNGENKHIDGLQKNQLTISCIADVNSLNESIVDNITRYVIDIIKEKCNINLNYYSVFFDILNNLDLLEGVIYPLMYTDLYTVNGIQYFTQTKIQNIISNLFTRDVLYTILMRRGIDTISNISRNY